MPAVAFAASIAGQPELAQHPYHQWTLPDGSPWALFYRVPDGYLVRFPELADFTIASDGTRVEARRLVQTSGSTLEQLYLNQVLPLALSRQRQLVLHASAVATGEGAIAFMGASGRGKSTLAASFALHGHPFLTDDSLLLQPSGNDYQVLPSHPSLRLWDDSRAQLLPGSAALAPAVDYSSKSRLLAGVGIPHCQQARRLQALFLLGTVEVDALQIRPALPATAMMECVRNCFLLELDQRELLTLHFDQLVALANKVPCFHLDFPRHYDALASVRQGILECLDSESAPAP